MNWNLFTLSNWFLCSVVSIFGFARESEVVKIAKTHQSDSGAPILSRRMLDERFAIAKREFDKRWDQFKAGKFFTPWKPNCPAEKILAEFERLSIERIFTWYEKVDATSPIREIHPDYAIAEDLLIQDHVRVPKCIAFEYNKSCTYFNSSNISINGLRFLAMEGTRSKDQTGFFHLLLNYHVNRLVRLTAESEGPLEKCYPYWKNRLSSTLLPNGKVSSTLSIPRQSGREPQIPYFFIDHWEDNLGIEPKDLLELIQSVREGYKPEEDLIAVHCSGGVGRTGTFIAGFALLHSIDLQLEEGKRIDEIEISIEEVVYQLSLQRFLSVAQPQQYLTLYRLVDLYLKEAAKSN